MGITLEQAMKIYPLNKASLIAGSQGIRKEIQSTNIMEVPDVSRWMKGGELLFTSGYAFQDKEILAGRLIEDLHKRKVTALAIKPGKYLNEIPKTMLQCADKLGFPILELPEELPYMDYMVPISEKIQNDQLYILRQVDYIHGRLLHAILEEKGYGRICDIISQVTFNPIYMINQEGRLREISNRHSYTEEELNALGIELYKTFSKRKITNLKVNKCNLLFVGESNKRMISIPIIIQNSHFGYLVMEEQNRKLTEFDEIILEHATSIMSVELLRERALVEKGLKSREKLLDDLLYHNYKNDEMIIRQAEYVNYDLSKPFFVFILDIEGINLTHHEIRLQENVAETIKIEDKLSEDIYEIFAKEGIMSILTNKRSQIIGMVALKQDECVSDYKKVFEKTVSELNKKYKKLNFIMTLGRSQNMIENAKKSLKDCEITLNVTKKVKKNSKVFCFDDLGVTRFICELKDYEPLREFYNEIFGELIEYDKNNNTDLINTLCQYFICNRNIKKTAESMFLHKNTISYRIHRIRQLTGYTLENSDEILNLMLCIKYSQLFEQT